MADKVKVSLSSKNIVMQGWMCKQGDYTKIWSKRYFCLLSDGRFVGFKEKPELDSEVKVYNNFSIIGAQISTEFTQSSLYIMKLRCLQSTTSELIMRVFKFDTIKERDEWVDAIKQISRQNDSAPTSHKSSSGNIMKQPTVSSHRAITDYRLIKLLGEGTFGKVVLCEDKKTKELFAIKGICKRKIEKRDHRAHVLEETKVLLTVCHPFLTRTECCFEDPENIYFVMEFVQGGEMFYHLSKIRYFGEKRARLYVAEITLALEYLHANDIIYRDLKLENIMIDREGHVKLTDFGLCKTNSITKGTTTFCGTLEYLAPEHTNNEPYNLEVDWWSLGVVCYEMLTGSPIFDTEDADFKQILEMLKNIEIRIPREHKNRLSKESQGFMLALLEKNPHKRLGSRKLGGSCTVKRHPFFKELDWDDIYHKRIKPEFLPEIKGKLDTNYFHTAFTERAANFVFEDSDDE